MPIKVPAKAEEYRPSVGEAKIAQQLRDSAGRGLSYSKLKESTGLSDTALSKFIMRLQRYNLITRDEKRTYHLTVIGLRYLMSLKPTQISADELKAQRKRDIARLWREVRQLQEKVLRIMWLPYADPTSRLLFSASGGSPDLLYIGALKSKDGKEILSFKTPGIEELQKLGYTWN